LAHIFTKNQDHDDLDSMLHVWLNTTSSENTYFPG